jgi:hypothetical protein
MKSAFALTLTLLLGIAAQAHAKKPSFVAWSYTDKDIYPSALISTATVDWATDEEDQESEVGIYGDENGWFGVTLYDAPEGAKVTVEISADGGWLKPSKLTITTEDDDPEVLVMPKAIYDYDALHAIKQQKPVNFTTKVTINGKVIGEETETMILRSVNECPFMVDMGEDEEPADISWLFAGYVNENHPWIDGLLKEALTTGIVDSFDGYQSGDPDKVIAQVFAIWNTLQRRGMKYSDITASPPSKTVASQVVRFLDDSVENRQANCVDGSVLLASVLTKISINCGLVLVPGHCYLAFDLAPDGELDVTAPADERTVLGLETTMMGADNLKPLDELMKMPGRLRKEIANKEQEASKVTFGNALEAGSADLAANADNFAEDGDPNYVFVSIKDARELGITPIASGLTK